MLAFCENSQEDVDSLGLGSNVFLEAVVLGAVFFGAGFVALMDDSALTGAFGVLEAIFAEELAAGFFAAFVAFAILVAVSAVVAV
jgi:hypothetical protein